MTKPRGLGRKHKDDSKNIDPHASQGDEKDPVIYFPQSSNADDDEMGQLQAMYNHAEASLDQPETALPLLRGIIHECDRMGKESSEPFSNQFWTIFGCALFNLGLIEGDTALIEAAVDRWNLADAKDGLLSFLVHQATLYLSSTPPQNNNNQTATRQPKEEILKECQYYWNLFSKVEDKPLHLLNVINFLYALEAIDPALSQGLFECMDVAIGEYPLEQQMEVIQSQFTIIEAAFEKDNYELCAQTLSKIEKYLCALNATKDESRKQDNADAEAEVKVEMGKLRVEWWVWVGCMREACAEEAAKIASGKGEDAQDAYDQAISIYKELNSVYNVEIPQDIIDLQQCK